MSQINKDIARIDATISSINETISKQKDSMDKFDKLNSLITGNENLINFT